jgi:hypothetical protein
MALPSVLVGYGTATAVGFTLGFLFSAISVRFAPPALHQHVWVTLPVIARDMAMAEAGRDFVAAYRRLGLMLAKYLGRNVGGLLVGFLLLAIAGYVLNALVFLPWDSRSAMMSTRPAALSVSQDASGYVVVVPGRSIPIKAGPAPVKAAICDGLLTCTLTAALNFENVPLSGGTPSSTSTILLRTGGPAWNPFFPWLNDLEFVFLAASVAGAACGFRKPRRK